jgi:hypothetical protein
LQRDTHNHQNKKNKSEFNTIKQTNTQGTKMNYDSTEGDLSLEEEIALVKEVGTLTTSLMAEQHHLTELRSKISNYESMFEKLKRMTGVESIEEMVSTYVANEEVIISSLKCC